MKHLLADDAAYQAWKTYQENPPTDRPPPRIPYCDPYCDKACLYESTTKLLLDAKNTARAAELLAGLGAYRSCSEQTVPALREMKKRYASSPKPMQAAIRTTVSRLHTEGAGFASDAKFCAIELAAWLPEADGELRDAIACGLAIVGIWEDDPAWLAILQKIPATEKCMIDAWYSLPKVLTRHMSNPEARGLRYLSDETLRRYRNAIFARYGRRFKTESLQKFFDGQPWYKANDNYSDKLLRRHDRANLKSFVAENTRRSKP